MGEVPHWIAAKWVRLGIQLKIPSAKLRAINRNCHHDTQRGMTEVMAYLLQNAPESWPEELAQAMEAMGEYALAERIRKKTSQG